MTSLTALLWILAVPVGYAIGALIADILWRITH